MAKVMKVAVVHAFGKPLAIEEVPIPAPCPGEVLLVANFASMHPDNAL